MKWSLMITQGCKKKSVVIEQESEVPAKHLNKLNTFYQKNHSFLSLKFVLFFVTDHVLKSLECAEPGFFFFFPHTFYLFG